MSLLTTLSPAEDVGCGCGLRLWDADVGNPQIWNQLRNLLSRIRSPSHPRAPIPIGTHVSRGYHVTGEFLGSSPQSWGGADPTGRPVAERARALRLCHNGGRIRVDPRRSLGGGRQGVVRQLGSNRVHASAQSWAVDRSATHRPSIQRGQAEVFRLDPGARVDPIVVVVSSLGSRRPCGSHRCRR